MKCGLAAQCAASRERNDSIIRLGSWAHLWLLVLAQLPCDEESPGAEADEHLAQHHQGQHVTVLGLAAVHAVPAGDASDVCLLACHKVVIMRHKGEDSPLIRKTQDGPIHVKCEVCAVSDTTPPTNLWTRLHATMSRPTAA